MACAGGQLYNVRHPFHCCLGVVMKKLAEYVSTLKHGVVYDKKSLFEQVGT